MTISPRSRDFLQSGTGFAKEVGSQSSSRIISNALPHYYGMNGRHIRLWTKSWPDGEKSLTCTQASSGPSQSFSSATGLAAPIFQSDFRLRYAFMCIAVSAVYFIHVLIYKRKTPAEVRDSLTIFIPVIGLSVWLSFTLFTADSPYNFFPLLVWHVRRVRPGPLVPKTTTPGITSPSAAFP